ncbi:ThuA domain-containing protein [Neolewinella aurantiaca]|nr:ThuA domain-containing protein [Neolewinella aurantiaca]
MNDSRAQLQPAVLLFLVSILLFLAYGCGSSQPEVRSALVFSKTAKFRHASIEDGKKMFLRLAEEKGFSVDTTEDASVFTQENLSKYNLIIFLSTTGDILNEAQQTELERFMKAGGNWMGIHAAADTEYKWPWYNKLCGAWFLNHPKHQDATIIIDEPNHPSVAHLNETWKRFDEWYNYKNIEEGITPVMRVDETSYEGGKNGDFHPMAWYRDVENGRSFYTGVGHTPESYTDHDFIAHIWGGMEYAWGDGKPVDYSQVKSAPEENRFEVEALVTGMREPMEMELLPDGRPLWVTRQGEIHVYDPDFETSAKVAELDVWTEFEDGLLGVAVDPDFVNNEWLYLYYSPNTEESVNRLSRFKFSNNQLVMDSEQQILDVPTDRNKCCHSGGSIEFGGTGLLHLSVGDNTNPFESDGFAPIDDSREEPNFDARRSSANTMDLRGGIVRIKVEEDGSYTIPEGNLFKDPEVGRPEIYAMGMRNPFRIHVDQHNGNVYWGDVGPDAGKDSTGIGPRGHDEVNVAREAGFFGWPLFIGDNKRYHARDFKTGELGDAFDPAKPINNSAYNTGAKELPPAQPAMIYYPYAESPEWPLMGTGGRNAMAGPVFYRDDFNDSDSRFPEYYDGKFFFYDWMRDHIMAADLDETGYVTDFERFLPNQDLRHPMDMMFSPDGDLYIIEYGRKWFSRNNDARLLRIRFNAGNRRPVPELEIAETIGTAPFQLRADASASLDYDGDDLSYTWLLDGKKIGSEAELNYEVPANGEYTLTMVVQDEEGNESKLEKPLIVGNSIPKLAIEIAGNSSFFWPGDRLDYNVEVSDLEDGTIDPAAITVSLDYLEGEDLVQIEQGHQVAGQGTANAIGKSLIDDSDCASCHAVNESSIGPSYQSVADRYRKDKDAVKYLSGKIIAGGGGVWGEQSMAAHPDLSEGDAAQMAEYILSLAGPAPNAESRPAKGIVALDKHKEGTPGRYYLQASYTDQGGPDGLPRLTTKKVVVLRAPVLAADKFTEGKKVMAYHVDGKDNPMGDEEMDLLVANGGGWASYGAVDLTGIEAIKAKVALVPQMTAGGTIKVRSGHPVTGKVVAEATIKQGVSTYGVNDVILPVSGAGVGSKPLYFTFSADSDAPDAVMGAILTIEFMRTELSR